MAQKPIKVSDLFKLRLTSIGGSSHNKLKTRVFINHAKTGKKFPKMAQRELLEIKKLCAIAPFNKVTHFILKNRYYINIKK